MRFLPGVIIGVIFNRSASCLLSSAALDGSPAKPMDRDAIRNQIGKILGSESFAGKNQLKKLLEVLFQNMDSQATLKPDRVIRELWPEDRGAKHSADVATEMNRLRKALDSYYSLEGQSDSIRIFLPNRSAPTPVAGKERRWIAAEPRVPMEGARAVPVSPVSAELPVLSLPLAPRVHPRRGLKLIPVIFTLVFAIALGAYFAKRSQAKDSRPQSGRLDFETLIVTNAAGEELWRKSFPGGFWREFYEQGLAPRIWFGDLEGDGSIETLLLYHPAVGAESTSTTLICYSDHGKERWRWTPGRAQLDTEEHSAIYTTFGFGVLRAAPGQARRIVVSSNELYYPHQIAIVDAHGKTISEYWHSGHLAHLALVTLEPGGGEQIIATGISNGYHQATMIVLDPNRVFGASTEAARPEIQIRGMGAAQERLRLLFPRSDLNKSLAVYSQAMAVYVDQGVVHLPVLECELVPRCYMWYAFDKDFQLLSASPDDQFRSAHKEFYLKSKTDHAFSAEEEAQFQKVRCLAGCKTEFVPVLNPDEKR
ncbi:MAG: hypothetical protein WAK26_09495 [Terracidiphilus sp.]